MDSQKVKTSVSASLSNSVPRNPSHSSFPYRNTVPLTAVPTTPSALPRTTSSTQVTPSTTLLPNASHLRSPPLPSQSHSHPRPLSVSQNAAEPIDNMSRPASALATEQATPPSRNSPQLHTQRLQQTPVQPLISASNPHHSPSQSLPKLDPFPNQLAQPVLDGPDRMRSGQLPLASPLSSTPVQQYDPSNSHRQAAQDSHLRNQQHPHFSSSSSQEPLTHLQTHPIRSNSLPPEPLPQMSVPPSSQQIQSSVDAHLLRTVHSSTQNLATQSHISQPQSSSNDQSMNRQSSHQNSRSLPSPKQTSRQQARPRVQFSQPQQSVDRQRAVQQRQPPSLPPRPSMLAPPRGSVVMQDVPRYQRQVVPTVRPHPAHVPHVAERGSPGGQQQSTTPTAQVSNSNQRVSNIEAQHHSMYPPAMMPPPRQPSPVSAMTKDLPSSAAAPAAAGQQNSLQNATLPHEDEHRQQHIPSDHHSSVPSFHRDLGKQESNFSQGAPGELRSIPHRSSALSSTDLRHSVPNRLGDARASDMYLGSAAHVTAENSGSPPRGANVSHRVFDPDPMTMHVRNDRGQPLRGIHITDARNEAIPAKQRTQDGLFSGSADSAVPSLAGVINPVDGRANMQGQPGGESRPELESSSRRDMKSQRAGDGGARNYVASSSLPGIGNRDLFKQQSSTRDHERVNDNVSSKNRSSLSKGFRPSSATPPAESHFAQGLHDRALEPNIASTTNQMTVLQDMDKKLFRGDENEWKKTTDEKERHLKSYSGKMSGREPTTAIQNAWRNEGRSAPPLHVSSVREAPQARALQQLSSAAQPADPVGAPVINSAAPGPEDYESTNPRLRLQIDAHRSSMSASDPMEVVSSIPTDGGKNMIVDSGLVKKDAKESSLARMNITDTEQKLDRKEERTPITQGTDRPGIPEESTGSQQKQLKVEDALAYLEKVKSQFSDQLLVYNLFLDIMKEFKAESIDTNEVIRRVSDLFQGHKDLILGFNTFLPPGYKIRVIENTKTGILNTGFHGPAGDFNLLPSHRKISSKALQRQVGKRKGSTVSSPKDKDIKRPISASVTQGGLSGTVIGSEHGDQGVSDTPVSGSQARLTSVVPKTGAARRTVGVEDAIVQNSRALHQSGSKLVGTEARAHEFERAIGFVTAIKERFAESPDTFNEFLDTLRRFREEQKSIREVFEVVADLFGPHKDLLSQFKEFIPTIAFSGIPEAKSAKGRGTSHVPRRTQGPKVISESTLSGRHGAVNGKTKSRHRGQDMQFFEDLKSQLGPNKAHLYTEFIKCLSLFSQGIVSREELLHLTGEILQDDQDAHASFLDYLESMANIDGMFDGEHHFSSSVSSEGEPTAVDAARIAYYTSKPMSEIAAEAGIEQMHSYRRMPHDFPPCEYNGRSVQEKRTLNDTWINVTTGSEDYSFKFMRRNQNEDNLFRCEDDRYELDLVIETNASTIMKLETIVATISKLPLGEKKRHALAPGALSPVHFNAIQRIYGDSGSEVLSQLKMNPSMAVPVVLKRLKEKDITWRRARMEMNKVWREVGERNFHRSLDHRSGHFKAVDKKDLSTKSLLMDIIDPSASVAARDAEMARARGYSVENGGGGANHRSQALKAVLAAAKLSSDGAPRSLELRFGDAHVHRVVCDLMSAVVDDEASRRSIGHFTEVVQSFFAVSFEKTQIHTSTSTEKSAQTRSAILYGDDAVYIAFRLYHLLFERVTLAFDLAREQIADRERREKLNEEGKSKTARKGLLANIETRPSHLTKALNGQEADNKFSLGPSSESFEEICENFLALAKQFVRGKVDWSRYEDRCRMLLGVDSYGLFTIDKTVQKVVKAIETMFTTDSPAREFFELFHRCKARLKDSSENDGQLDIEGVELLYSVAASQHLSDMRGPGANLIRFQSSSNGVWESRVLIHIIGQTGDDEIARIFKEERAVVEEFVEFYDCHVDSDREKMEGGGKGAAMKGETVSLIQTGSGGLNEVARKTNAGKADDRRQMKKKIGRAEYDFLRFAIDDRMKAAEGLRSGSLIMNNGLEWRLDAKGVMRFVAGKSDFLFNSGRKRAWNEALDAKTENERCSRSKRMRRKLHLDDTGYEVEQVAGTDNCGTGDMKSAPHSGLTEGGVVECDGPTEAEVQPLVLGETHDDTASENMQQTTNASSAAERTAATGSHQSKQIRESNNVDTPDG